VGTKKEGALLTRTTAWRGFVESIPFLGSLSPSPPHNSSALRDKKPNRAAEYRGLYHCWLKHFVSPGRFHFPVSAFLGAEAQKQQHLEHHYLTSHLAVSSFPHSAVGDMV